MILKGGNPLVLARIPRLQRLLDQLPPQWYGWDDQGNPVYVILHKGFLSIRRGGYGGGLESAQVGDEIYSRQVDVSWDPGYGEIRRLCEDDVELPETDYGDPDITEGEGGGNGMEGSDTGDALSREPAESRPAELREKTDEGQNRLPLAFQEKGKDTEDSGKVGTHSTRAHRQKGPGGDDVDLLIRKWTSSHSAADEKQRLNERANLNRIRFEKLQKVSEDESSARLRELLGSMFTGGRFEVLLWVENSYDVPDSENLKLVILKKDDPALLSSILKCRGMRGRRCRNTVLFLVPAEIERRWCLNTIKYALACEAIIADKKLSLAHEQKTLLHQDLQRLGFAMAEAVRKLYRIVCVPEKDGYRTIDLGVSGSKTAGLDQAVYERLLRDGVIVERIEPQEIRNRYLKGRDYLSTADLYEMLLTNPGEPRPAERSGLAEGIRLGVQEGTFGIGRLERGVPLCRHFMERTSVTLEGNEIILSEKQCLGRGVIIP